MEDTKKDTTLILLKILMQKSNRNNPLKKDEILDIFADEYDMFIEPKQFYRCYEKLINAEYPVVKIKGKSACYYYDGLGLRESDALYLTNVIANLRLSFEDKCRLATPFTYERVLNPNTSPRGKVNMNLEYNMSLRDNLNYSILDDFNLIYLALKKKMKVEYKIYKDGKIGPKEEGMVLGISGSIETGELKVKLSSGVYNVNEIINVRILKKSN